MRRPGWAMPSRSSIPSCAGAVSCSCLAGRARSPASTWSRSPGPRAASASRCSSAAGPVPDEAVEARTCAAHARVMVMRRPRADRSLWCGRALWSAERIPMGVSISPVHYGAAPAAQAITGDFTRPPRARERSTQWRDNNVNRPQEGTPPRWTTASTGPASRGGTMQVRCWLDTTRTSRASRPPVEDQYEAVRANVSY